MSKAPVGWRPNIFGKQNLVYDTRKRIVLVDGPRLAAKTMAVAHKVMRHLTETPGPCVGCFAPSIKASKDAGSWNLLIDTIIPEWQEAGMLAQNGKPIDYLTVNSEGQPGPKVDANTRTAYFKWRNCYGGTGSCMLFSIDNINELPAKVKGKIFSMIWLMELSSWDDRRVLSVMTPSFRSKHLIPFDGTPQNYHQWIADTNPHEDQGAESWFYKLFYIERNHPPVDKPNDSQTQLEENEMKRAWIKDMEVIRMDWRENPFVTKEQVRDLRFNCGSDQALLDSYYYGVHGEGGVKKEKHFANFFIKSKHVVGGADPEEGDQIAVSKNTTRLYAGWDLGNINHGAGILDKWFRVINGQERACWSVLGEKVFIGEEMTLSAFTHEFLAMMDNLEKLNAKKYDWIHWSDDSAINVFRPTTGSYDYMEILAASKGRIHLQGVNKPSGSVRVRVRILRQLLREERIYVSACCPAVIAMLENLKKSQKEYVVRDEHVHTFDWLTYPIYSESQEDLFTESFKPQTTEEAQAEEEAKKGVISV